MTVSPGGILDVGGIKVGGGIVEVGGIKIGDGKIMVLTGKTVTVPGTGKFGGGKIPETIDLIAAVVALSAAVDKLKLQVKQLGGTP